MHRRCSEHHRGSSVSTGAGAMAALASVAIVAAFAAAALQLLIVGVTGAAGFMAATLGASTWAVVFGMVLVVGNAWTLQLLRAQTPYGLVTFVEQARCGFSHWQVKTGFCSALMGALNFGAGLGVGKEGPAIVLATTVSVWIRRRTPWLLDHRLATIAAVSAAVSAMFGMPFCAHGSSSWSATASTFDEKGSPLASLFQCVRPFRPDARRGSRSGPGRSPPANSSRRDRTGRWAP